jgi:hypothetical protein
MASKTLSTLYCPGKAFLITNATFNTPRFAVTVPQNGIVRAGTASHGWSLLLGVRYQSDPQHDVGRCVSSHFQDSSEGPVAQEARIDPRRRLRPACSQLLRTLRLPLGEVLVVLPDTRSNSLWSTVLPISPILWRRPDRSFFWRCAIARPTFLRPVVRSGKLFLTVATNVGDAVTDIGGH